MKYIYRIVFPNGKSYIGMTNKTPQERLKRHIYQSRVDRKRKLYKAINEINPDSLYVEELECIESDDVSILKKEERKFIKKYDSINNGYNSTKGGEGGNQFFGKDNFFYGKHHKESTKKTLSIKHSGKKLSEETKRKISESCIGNFHTDEYKKRAKEYWTKVKGIKVICNEDKIVFQSISECSEYYNICRSDIRRVCERKRSTAKGKTFNFVGDETEPIKDPRKKPIVCLNNGIEYESTKKACDELNLVFQHVNGVLKGRQKTTKGYKFVYAWQYRAKSESGKV